MGGSANTSAAESPTQQVVVTAPSYASTSGTLTAYQYSDGAWHVVLGPFRAQLGRHGLSDTRSEGDGTTPTGTYGFGSTMYGVAAGAPNPRYAYHHLGCGDWWSGVRDSTYNTFQQIPCGQTMDSSEALWEQTTAYQHFAVITFNMDPTVIGRGSAIFLHDATASGTTAGCMAVAPSALDAVLGWLDPAQDPVIRIGTSSQVGPPAPLAASPAPPRPAPPRPARLPAPTGPPNSRVVRPPTTVRPSSTTSSTEATTTTVAAPPSTTALATPAIVPIRSATSGGRSGKTALAMLAAGLMVAPLVGVAALSRRAGRCS